MQQREYKHTSCLYPIWFAKMHCHFVCRLVWMPDEGQCLNWSLQCCCKCKYYQVSPLFKHCFHLIAREAKACQSNQGNKFYVVFISRTSVSQASQSLFCDIHDLMKLCFSGSKLLHCHLLASGTGSTAVHQAQSISQQVDRDTQKSSFLTRYLSSCIS